MLHLPQVAGTCADPGLTPLPQHRCPVQFDSARPGPGSPAAFSLQPHALEGETRQGLPCPAAAPGKDGGCMSCPHHQLH